jgi:uncharacterized membrane protein YvlD (DUF360 family)
MHYNAAWKGALVVRFLLRVALVSLALSFALPHIAGVRFSGDPLAAVATSLVFNLTYFGLEWLLAVIAFGINIGTLGLGVFITAALKFVASVLAPSLALMGTSHVMPKFLHISHYFPEAVVAGLVLGGLMWVGAPEKPRSKRS